MLMDVIKLNECLWLITGSWNSAGRWQTYKRFNSWRGAGSIFAGNYRICIEQDDLINAKMNLDNAKFLPIRHFMWVG